MMLCFFHEFPQSIMTFWYVNDSVCYFVWLQVIYWIKSAASMDNSFLHEKMF